MPLKYNTRFCRAKARTKIDGKCMQPAMPNGLCRMHFGKGYGPKTPEGMLRRAQANLKHGMRSNAAMEERRMMKKMMQWREDLDNV
jgi:hypothetical protein